MVAIRAERALLPDGALGGPVAVDVDGGNITRVSTADGSERCPHHLLVPGFVDLQVNGHDDVDVAAASGGDWDRLDELLVDQGVTTWCPTLVTAPLGRLERAMARVGEAMARPGGKRPAIAGIHLEGPFLGGAPGAHRRDWLLPFDLTWLAELPASVRIVTLAPELEGAADVVRALADRGVVVSLGHSTATAAQASAAVDAGARLVTHLFNGMGPLHHRQPGLVGLALADPRLVVSIIADLVHVDAVALRIAFAAKGPGGIALVTDAIAWRAGNAHAGSEVARRDGGPRLADGTLAGSALTMDAAVRNAVASGVDLAAALVAAAMTPAAVLGLADRGAVAVGRRADLVALDEQLGVEAVWIGGQRLR